MVYARFYGMGHVGSVSNRNKIWCMPGFMVWAMWGQSAIGTRYGVCQVLWYGPCGVSQQ